MKISKRDNLETCPLCKGRLYIKQDAIVTFRIGDYSDYFGVGTLDNRWLECSKCDEMSTTDAKLAARLGTIDDEMGDV